MTVKDLVLCLQGKVMYLPPNKRWLRNAFRLLCCFLCSIFIIACWSSSTPVAIPIQLVGSFSLDKFIFTIVPFLAFFVFYFF